MEPSMLKISGQDISRNKVLQ